MCLWSDTAPPHLPNVYPHFSLTEYWSHTEPERLSALERILTEEFTVPSVSSLWEDHTGKRWQELAWDLGVLSTQT